VNRRTYPNSPRKIDELLYELIGPDSLAVFWEGFLKLLAPFAPFISEELWEKLGHKTSIHLENWPQYQKKLIQENQFELVIQINGKVRDKILVATDISQKQAEKIALSQEKIVKLMSGQKIKKIIFVKNRLINIVVN